MLGPGMIGTLALIYAGFTALAAAACVTVVRKAGYSGWWVAAALIPLVNVVLVFMFAFADWPVLQQLRRASTQRPVEPAPHPSFAAAGAAIQPSSFGYATPAPPHPLPDPYFGA